MREDEDANSFVLNIFYYRGRSLDLSITAVNKSCEICRKTLSLSICIF